MGEKDYAIIVGVTYHDPELNTLKGPENDAKDFYDWATSRSGGAVPTENAALIRSSEPNFQGLIEPTADRVNGAINNLYKIAAENDQRELGFKVGRRLYFYLAGHGIAPRYDQTAVLMADATKQSLDLHILGQYSADCLFNAAMFDEILLFLDCCREEPAKIPVLNQKLEERRADKTEHIVRFYGNASRWGKNTREKVMLHDGQPHGVFTTALLTGLKGAACDRDGKITAGALSKYLINFTQCFLTEEERLDAGLSNEPNIDYESKFEDKLIVEVTAGLSWMEWAKKFLPGTSLMQKMPVKITLPESAVGLKAEVRSGIDLKKVLDSTTAQAESLNWELKLEPGLYLALIADDARYKPFQVGCGGQVDVVF